jgi:restriction system protein
MAPFTLSSTHARAAKRNSRDTTKTVNSATQSLNQNEAFELKTMWMVRAGEDAFLIDDFKNKDYVAIGFDILSDLTDVSGREGLKKRVEVAYKDYKKGQINSVLSQVSKFLFDFKIGDYVLSYDPGNRVYPVGEIQSNYEYNIELREYHNVRRVKWLGKVARDGLSIKTRNTLGAISTLFQINETSAKEIIGVLEGKGKSREEAVEEADEESLKEDMVSQANELIKDKIMKLDWDDMQELVAGILRAMGYKTTVSNPGADRGKDIEASPDGLMLTEPRILVQVKHRPQQQMNRDDVGSLISLLRQQKGLYVSTGGFSKDAKYEAERSEKQITLIDADRLVQLIIQNYDKFDVDTKLLIPLSKIYWPI